MKQTFAHLENVPNIAATVCDKEGIVLYQNNRAIARDGNVVGKNLYNCHGEKGTFITGSDFLMDGGATASYFYGPLKPEQ